LESITRVIAPTIGRFVLGSIGTWAPGMVSAVVILWAIWLAYRRIVLVKAPVEPETQPVEPCCGDLNTRCLRGKYTKNLHN
jgi:hypothetical protein